jgi:DNA-binding CsgD family transcriptional regulator
LGDAPTRLELARSLVDLGAKMRRRGARRESRGPLRAGHELALACHARGLADHARDELAASGVHVERGDLARRDELTPSERRIATMAAEGASNKEIALSLFLTIKTVEMHLSSAYRKLDIRSRRDLGSALASSAGDPAA